MRKPLVFMAAVGLTACGLAGPSDPFKAASTKAEGVFEGPVPRAQCGPGSLPETGMQGQVPAEDQASGRAALGYTCNMEFVGHEGTNATWQMAWYEDCAYYARDFPSNTALIQANDVGVVVVDARDPARPVRTDVLDSPAMLDPHESLAANDKRGLLAGVAGWDAAGNGPVMFDLYDVATDCRYPQLMASVPVQIPEGHEGDWAPDGLTYYGSSLWSTVLTPIDVTDPNQPRPVSVLETGLTHGLSISNDGTRAYLAQVGLGTGPQNGMEVWDVSAVQARQPGAQARRIGAVYWEYGQAAQHTIPLTIQGRPFLLHVDEFGSGAAIGVARIIDISDETAPFVVSKLKLEVHLPENQDSLAADSDPYQGHYCWVPQRHEPGVVGCSYLPSGLRIFDIRDPYRPREIAYFNPGRPGNLASRESARVRFVPERGEVWFTDQRSGFYIVRFTNGVWPFRK
jgi:hypothetical protein